MATKTSKPVSVDALEPVQYSEIVKEMLWEKSRESKRFNTNKMIEKTGNEEVMETLQESDPVHHESDPVHHEIVTIPKNIYTFWDTEPPSSLVKSCMKNWEKMNPEHNVTLITYSTMSSIIDLNMTPLPRNFYSIDPRYQADWIRLAILLQKGGVWVDASFIMLDSLSIIHQLQEKDQSEGVQFYFEPFTSLIQYPILENWFIAAGKKFSLCLIFIL